MARTWGGRSAPALAAELVAVKREAEARALELLQLHRERATLQQQLLEQEAEAAAMQAEAEEEAEAEQRGLQQQLHDMRNELNELRASCSTAEREVADEP